MKVDSAAGNEEYYGSGTNGDGDSSKRHQSEDLREGDIPEGKYGTAEIEQLKKYALNVFYRHLPGADQDILAFETTDGLLKVLRRYEGRNGAKIRTMLYRVIINRVVDLCRTHKRFCGLPDDLDYLANETTTPFDKLVEKEDVAILREALDEAMADLSPFKREVIDRFFYGGLSYKEIAKLTGRSKDTVGTAKFNALIQLGFKLEEILTKDMISRRKFTF